jgi:hypothetical protein
MEIREFFQDRFGLDICITRKDRALALVLRFCVAGFPIGGRGSSRDALSTAQLPVLVTGRGDAGSSPTEANAPCGYSHDHECLWGYFPA